MEAESLMGADLLAKEWAGNTVGFESSNFRYAHVVNGDTGGFKLRCESESGSTPDVCTDPDSSGLGLRL